MEFPELSPALRAARLAAPKGKVRMVLDTDTYNEVDDQFAVVQSLLSPDRLDIEAIYAAPFHNNRSDGAGDGMQKSYEEILRLLERLDVSPEGFVHKGSTRFLQGSDAAQESAAAHDLVERAHNGNAPLYVVAIGAITNVASALLLDPSIVEKIVVVWLGGQPLYWPSAREFNLQQDLHASRLIFDCGVPLVQIPCSGVASHLLTTAAELEAYVAGRGAIGDYLVEVFKAYSDDHFGWSKEIWDISAPAWLLDAAWVPSVLVHSPILTDQYTYSVDHRRHLIRIASQVRRNPIFKDLFKKIEARANGG
jgi:purine nucleosidase